VVLEASWGDPPDATAAGGVRATIDRDAVMVLAGPALRAAEQPLLVAYTGHLRVVRDRARAEHQAVAAARLEQGNRTRTALLAAVSHDLRTPLAAIKAAAGSLRSTDVTWSREERAELLATVEDGADRMSRLVGNLLDMTRLQTGAVTPLLAEVDLDQVVADAVRPLPAVQQQDGGRGRLVTAFPADLPPVWADAGLLGSVVANLVENALRYSGGEVEVTATGLPDADGRPGVALDVVDRGPGIAAAQRPQLFQPFRRLGDVPQGDGLGLGLAVARGLTEAMQGTLEARDTPGGGLTMRLWLPAGPEPV
jgi:two-component system sensor histidine kinase KdpD